MGDERERQDTDRWTLPRLVERTAHVQLQLEKLEREMDAAHQRMRGEFSEAVTRLTGEMGGVREELGGVKVTMAGFKGYVFGGIAAGMAGAAVVAWVVQLLMTAGTR